jgi:hypothetical protein
MPKATPLAPSPAEAAAATERLAAWVVGALTAIVIGGVAIVIYVPHEGHAGGSSWLLEINASQNGTATNTPVAEPVSPFFSVVCFTPLPPRPWHLAAVRLGAQVV